MPWTADDIPDQSGRTVIVTGGNGGLGLETCRELARKGAHVVMAARNLDKAEEGLADIREDVPDADVAILPLDLADLESVRAFVATFGQRHDRLDLLVNNAGVMAIPYRQTADGFEMQIGTNHLGHFALTGLLLPKLAADGPSRIVNVASNAHKMRAMRFDDLRSDDGYGPSTAYARSKLANLLFTYEAKRRLARPHPDIASVAAHPGYADTDLFHVTTRSRAIPGLTLFSKAANALLAQSVEKGALPQLYAATCPDVVSGDYIGPDGILEWRGHPKKVESNKRSHDEALARELWEKSEELTGVTWAL